VLVVIGLMGLGYFVRRTLVAGMGAMGDGVRHWLRLCSGHDRGSCCGLHDSGLYAVTELLEETRSRCPVCSAPCPATVRRVSGSPETIHLSRTCPDHGSFDACISSDARFYWLSKGGSGCAGGACCAGEGGPAGTLGRNANPGEALGVHEKLSTCLALIEIVNSCNLKCPTCYASSARSAEIDAVPLDNIRARVQGVIDRKGKIEILQLSGGEPTLHPQIFELLEWCRKSPLDRICAPEYQRRENRLRRRGSPPGSRQHSAWVNSRSICSSTVRRSPDSGHFAGLTCVTSACARSTGAQSAASR